MAIGRRTSRSLVRSLIACGVLVTSLLAPAPPVAAATCEVANAGTGTTYTTLQEAVNDAASGDTLEVRGTCVGKTIIRTTRLRLKGIATTEQPIPTLDGARLSRVLAVVGPAKVVIRDLTITNGKARSGSGISVYLANSLATRTRVTLSGDTSVAGNTAEVDGGGISNYGTLTLNDSASVTGNTAEVGGGISNSGTLTLNDSASVTGNEAGYNGGGIYIETDYYLGYVYVCSDEVTISPNDPDDPPKVRHVCP